MSSSRTVLSVFNLSPRRIGGIEGIARELSRQLGEIGWRSVLCFRSSPPESVNTFLQLPNVHIAVMEHTSRWRLMTQRELIGLLRHYRPSILHLNFLDLFAPFAAVARLHGVARVFFTDHISRPEGYAPRRSQLLKRVAYQMTIPVTKVFCVSEYVRQCWLDSGCLPPERLTTVYNGVDLVRCERSLTQRDSFRASHGIPADAIVVTQIASLTQEKGVQTLLEASRIVLDVAPQVVFLLAGDGRQREEYQRMAKELGLGERVQFIGLVSDPVGEGLFAASDVICQASNWQEAFGLSIAEAMACGKPVIATRVGGIPELVQHERTGLLVERGSSHELAAGIVKLVRSAELRQLYGNGGRETCWTKFDQRTNVAKMIDSYQLPTAGKSFATPEALVG